MSDNISKANVLNVLSLAMAQQVAPKAGAFGGCGRVYVSVPKEYATAVAAAAKKLGLIFQRKAHHGLRNALYIGYDNADGRALAKGEAVAAYLQTQGIRAYSEAFGD